MDILALREIRWPKYWKAKNREYNSNGFIVHDKVLLSLCENPYSNHGPDLLYSNSREDI